MAKVDIKKLSWSELQKLAASVEKAVAPWQLQRKRNAWVRSLVIARRVIGQVPLSVPEDEIEERQAKIDKGLKQKGFVLYDDE